MDYRSYSKFVGLDYSLDTFDVNQLAMLRSDNYIYNQVLHAFLKRGGSESWTASGDIWGIGGYPKEGTTLKTPVHTIPIRHRRDGATSYIEKLNWTTRLWEIVTQGASTSFDIGAVGLSARIADTWLLCAGRPAMIRDIDSGDIERLGGPAPTAAPSVAASVGAGPLTGTYGYYYTFYDSVTGWESSPSPLSSLVTLTAKDGELTSLETSAAKEGVDKKRIYRTITTGEQPHLLVDTIALATASYTDSTTDDNLGLASDNYDGINGVLRDNHQPPPSSDCYICAAHENRFWIAQGKNLYYSEAYDGSSYKLEQFSEDRKFSFPAIITGLAPRRTGGMLVFQPPGFGIHEIQGRSETEFQTVTPFPSEGSSFHTSVSWNNEFVTYWGASGPKLITPGGIVRDYDDQIKPFLRQILTEEFGSNVFIWSVWHEGSRQFLYGLTASSASAVIWQDTDSGAQVGWEDADTGAAIDWEVG